MKSFVLLTFAVTSLAQVGLWGQCGGVDYKGSTVCSVGVCCYSNPWYSQCLQNCPNQQSTTSLRTTTTSSSRLTTSSIRSVSSSSTTKIVTTASLSTTSRRSSIISLSTSIRSSPTPHVTSTSTAPTAAFTNPVVYADYPDNDVSIGPDGKFYLSASNFHYSPGAPILRSSDLQNWEAVGHSIPVLAFGDSYNLFNGTQAYRRGTWASSMRYRASDQTWYWIGCTDFWVSYVYAAKDVTGPWERKAVFYGTCFYDCGLFFDDDQSVYVVHDHTTVSITQLSTDLSTIVKTQQIATNPPGFEGMEGNRLYKINGTYYILNDSGPGSVTWIWRSDTVFGPWTSKVLQLNSGGPLPIGGSMPNQGSLIQSPLGQWHFVSFTWAFPLGRIPVIAPITWGSDGWPILGLTSSNAWPLTYPNALPQVPTAPWTGTDTFTGTKLSPRWEWNHNPDTTKYTINNGVTLSAATVTNDLYLARNTLTHRLVGGQPTATILLDFNNLADGDRTGLAAFKDNNHYIGLVRSGSTYTVVIRTNMTLSSTDWTTTNIGTDVASAVITKGAGRIWFRGKADARPVGAKTVTFEYSVDGVVFTPLGGAYKLDDGYQLFMGYRWGIFNHATKALGGSVKLLEFTQI